SVSMYYGFEAIIIAFVVGCLCPVYPITFIFQIIYIVKKHRMLTQKQRRFIIAMISLLLALLIIPSLIYLAIGK
ncbi:MAG: hypothetical protein IJZ25_03440, partial [Lachnospiraceae bacterium]|nr:hypothetical protein [Lachnospiraceae bacterium]